MDVRRDAHTIRELNNTKFNSEVVISAIPIKSQAKTHEYTANKIILKSYLRLNPDGTTQDYEILTMYIEWDDEMVTEHIYDKGKLDEKTLEDIRDGILASSGQQIEVTERHIVLLTYPSIQQLVNDFAYLRGMFDKYQWFLT